MRSETPCRYFVDRVAQELHVQLLCIMSKEQYKNVWSWTNQSQAIVKCCQVTSVMKDKMREKCTYALQFFQRNGECKVERLKDFDLSLFVLLPHTIFLLTGTECHNWLWDSAFMEKKDRFETCHEYCEVKTVKRRRKSTTINNHWQFSMNRKHLSFENSLKAHR